jgi:hypothetical protein
MRDVIIELESITPYSSSQPIEEDRGSSESWEAYEQRRWKDKAHLNEDGILFIPGVSFKLAIDEAAKLLKEKIKGKGNQTYTGLFTTGITAMSDVDIGIHIDNVKPVRLYCNADGRRGSGTRVWRYFPYIPSWKGSLEMKIFNDTIPEDVFERYVIQAGILTGVGRGRPITGCPAGNGRFKPIDFTWA